MSVPRKPDVDVEVVRDIAARALPGTDRPIVDRASTGTTTQVYRVHSVVLALFVGIAERRRTRWRREAWFIWSSAVGGCVSPMSYCLSRSTIGSAVPSW